MCLYIMSWGEGEEHWENIGIDRERLSFYQTPCPGIRGAPGHTSASALLASYAIARL